MENNENILRKDLNKNPIENVNGQATINEIETILNRYGITKTTVKLWGSGKPRQKIFTFRRFGKCHVLFLWKILILKI